MRPPTVQTLIEKFQPSEFVVEQRPDFCEPGRWPDLGVESRRIPAGHHELGKELITADELPHAFGFTHGPILPAALSAAEGYVQIECGQIDTKSGNASSPRIAMVAAVPVSSPRVESAPLKCSRISRPVLVRHAADRIHRSDAP
jgi:hypothetical protein